MKKIYTAIFIFLITLLFSSQAIAELYQWVDSNGTVHYSSTAPGNSAKKVKTIKETKQSNQDNYRYDSYDKKKQKQAKKKKQKKTERERYPWVKVKLFVTDWCPACKKAIAFFRKKGVQLTIYDVEKDPKAARKKKKYHNSGSIPVCVIGRFETVIIGYDERRFLKAME